MLNVEELERIGFKKNDNYSNVYFYDVNVACLNKNSIYTDDDGLYEQYTSTRDVISYISNNKSQLIKTSSNAEPFLGFLRINYVLNKGCTILNLFFGFCRASIIGETCKEVIRAIYENKTIEPFTESYYNHDDLKAIELIKNKIFKHTNFENLRAFDESIYDPNTIESRIDNTTKQGDCVFGILNGHICFSNIVKSDEPDDFSSYAEDLIVLQIGPKAREVLKKIM